MPVNIIKGGKSIRGRLSEELGQSLGSNLGTFLMDYSANKRLNETLESEELKKADPIKKASILEEAMRPYGEGGRNLIQRRLNQEREVEEKERRKNTTKALAMMARGEIPTEEMLRDVHPEEFVAGLKAIPKPQKPASPKKWEPQTQQEAEDWERKKATINAENKPTPIPKPAVATPFEKTQQQLAAKEYQKLSEQIPALSQAVENVSVMRKLAKTVEGARGVYRSLVGNKDAAQLEAMGLTSIGDILKVINPVGAVPKWKVEKLLETHAPRALDRKGVIEGKLNSIELFTRQALERAKEKQTLIQKHNGQVPPEEMTKFDQESATLVDAMIDYPVEGEEKKAEKKTEPVAPGTPMTAEVASRYKKIYGSREEAEKRAREDGYVW